MSALTKIKEAGFSLTLEGDNFKIIPFSKLTTKQREFLKSHKAEIISDLKAEPLIVICYTPRGEAIEIEARDPEHAEWLKRMNPKRVTP